MENNIVLYQSKSGKIELDIRFDQETLWLSQGQMGDLFGVGRQAITKHLKNIFETEELKEKEVCSILEQTARDGKTYKTKFYSLDAVISVGYRVNSTQATHFRIWSTRVLKDHLVKGYSLHQRRIEKKGIKELQDSIELLQKTLIQGKLVSDIGAATLEIINEFAKTWHVLRAYDEGMFLLSKREGGRGEILDYATACRAISALRNQLRETPLFGQEHSKGLASILGNIEQTFDGKALYKTSAERAGHLLYFIIKDHPFSDGNKRIACLLFLLYLTLQNISAPFNENGLVALALLVAESDPKQKEMMIGLTAHLLTKEEEGENDMTGNGDE